MGIVSIYRTRLNFQNWKHDKMKIQTLKDRLEKHDIFLYTNFIPLYRHKSTQAIYSNTVRFTSTSNDVISCIKYRLYIGEKGGRLGDRFREHLRDIK